MKIEVQIGCEFGYADFFLGKFVFLQENMWMWLAIFKRWCIVCPVSDSPQPRTKGA